ncbi:transposase [Clostridium sp. CS001]|uniref:RNA-guided endonuclease InsQ/TnpB family protein n=1 Tax=Clostridium sp. CS001 TaxID=2880648 RepID=UPI001CF1A764|nr:transposase [Clostridium sp. CS001]MCB2289613.1 transposase [Clostridium sp. CS001]
MLKGFKTEIKVEEKHINKINQSIGICRYLYNSYLAKNLELYQQFKDGLIDKKQAFMSANDFDKYINNEVKIQEEFKWIDNCDSKARKKAICNSETAFKRFFKGQGKFPKFKKKNKSDVKLYFPKNNKTDWEVERNKINIPSLKCIHLKEKGYIPTNAKVVSGTVSKKAERYYVSVLCEVEENNNNYSASTNEGLGIDLGIKDLAIVSNIDKPFKNINKTSKVRKLEKKLKRKQRQVSRKYEMNKQGKKFIKTNNIIKLENQTIKINDKLANIRNNYANNITSQLVKQKPSFITIEDLNVSGMMKNRHLSKAITKQCFFEFRRQLTYKCEWNNIELRVVDRFYPSSKTCNCCGYINKDLKLSDREFICLECGVIEDRDKNASYNLRDAKIYKIA